MATDPTGAQTATSTATRLKLDPPEVLQAVVPQDDVPPVLRDVAAAAASANDRR